MPRIFISYRRADWSNTVGRLYDLLVYQFGADNVFLDRESIESGDRFPEALERALAASDVLLAIVGPRWSGGPGESGATRLFDEKDFVAREIATALGGGRKVIPVLVSGATMPGEADLPQKLRAFHACQAQGVADDHFRVDVEALVDAVLDRPRGFARKRLDEFTRLARFVQRTAMVVPAVSLSAFFGAWIGMFGMLGLDTKVGSYNLALADLAGAVARENRVAIVALDKDTERAVKREFKPRDPFWRQKHALLIERLAEAGAAAIVFDIVLQEDDSADGEIARAVRVARQRGTRVVFAVREVRDGRPRLATALVDASAEWGVACLGHQEGYVFTIPLVRAVDREKAADPFQRAADERAERPALAMAGAFGGVPEFIRAGPREVIQRGATRTSIVPFSELTLSASSRCTALRDDDVVASRLILLSPLDYWTASPQRHSYGAWVEGHPSARPTGALRGKTVVVGVTVEDSDRVSVHHRLAAERRFGVELQADALRNLLSGFAVRPLEPFTQFFVMLAMSLLGAGACFVSLGWRRRWRIALVAGVLGIYLAFDAALLALAGAMLNPLYDIAAFCLAFALLGRLEKKPSFTPVTEDLQ